jgi:5-methylcytosine-specific restriction protein A
MSQKQDKQRIYNSKEWRLVRNAKLEKNPLCEVCAERGKIVAAQCVHHIIPIETATDFTYMKELAFRFDNLLSCCFQCHSEIHKELKSHSREAHQKASANAIERWVQTRTNKPKNND